MPVFAPDAPERLIRGSLQTARQAAGAAQNLLDFREHFRRALGIDHPEEFMKIKARTDKTWGMWVAFGRHQGQNCIWEFNVSKDRDFLCVGGGCLTLEATGVKQPPTYLKGTKRKCYLAGDIILVRELEWKHVVAHIYRDPADRSQAMKSKQLPSHWQLAYTLLNNGAPKKYKLGWQLLEIDSWGDGCGTCTLQPVLFLGDLPMPVGEVHSGFVTQTPSASNWDLNNRWFHRWLFDPSRMKWFCFGETVAELAAGPIKKVGWKAARKVLGKKVKKEVKERIIKKVLGAVPDAAKAFVKTFAKQAVAAMADQSARAAAQQIRSSAGKMSAAQPWVRKAFVAATVAFIQKLLSVAAGAWMANQLPKDQLTSMGERIALPLINHIGADMLPAVLAGIANSMNEASDESGNLDDSKFNDEMGKSIKDAAFVGFFKAMAGAVADAFTDYFVP